MRRDRLARGWSVSELARQMGSVNPAHLGRVESGKRPPTAQLAARLDSVFPERRGWYLQWLDDIRTAPEVPATFRSWGDYEDRSATLRVWMPGIIDGLAQTRGYARALIGTLPAVTAATTDSLLAARMARQERVLGRAHPPMVTFLVDEPALHRLVGTAETMAGQCRHLLDVAAMPTVTVQVMPPVAHAANASGFVLADDAVYAESVVSGGVHTDPQTVSGLALRFDSLRGECHRVSESLALIEGLESQWTGGNLPTRTPTAGSAPK